MLFYFVKTNLVHAKAICYTRTFISKQSNVEFKVKVYC